MIYTEMAQVIDSMKDTIKLQGRARAEKRAREAERDQQEFKEKLQRVAASQMELEGMAQKLKGAEAAAQRDQLIGLLSGL